MKDLARAVADGGNLNGAIPLMRAAVSMERALYPNAPHPDLAEVLNDMGYLLDERGDLDESEKFYRESLAMYRALLGEKHPYVATALENVALILQDKGDLAGAEALYVQSLHMRAELVGENHPDYAMTLFNIALLQYDQGKTREAFTNIRRVLGIYRKASLPDQPETARVLNTMGFWSTLAGDRQAADRYLQEALAMRRRLFDEHHPDVASSLMMLAILRVSEEKYPEALQLAQSAKTIYTADLSADHWRTAIAESAEGAALTGLGRFPEAETELAHSYGILSKSGGAPLVFRTLALRYLDTLHRRDRRAAPLRAAARPT
jgi:tetratricopeptide (TPR) repeat protein